MVGYPDSGGCPDGTWGFWMVEGVLMVGYPDSGDCPDDGWFVYIIAREQRYM